MCIFQVNRLYKLMEQRLKFPKAARLLFSSQYHYVSRGGKQIVGSYVILEVCKAYTARSESPSLTAPLKLGITASRRFGKAHERNRFKRIVREAFRLTFHQLPKNLYIIVKPRTFAKFAKTQDIQAELLQLIKPLAQPNVTPV